MEYYILTPFLFILRILEIFAQFTLILVISNTISNSKKILISTMLFTIPYELIKVAIPQYLTSTIAAILFTLITILVLKLNYKKAIASYLLTGIFTAITDCVVCTVLIKILGLQSFEDITQSDLLTGIAKILVCSMIFFAIQVLKTHKSSTNFQKTENVKSTTELIILGFTFFLLLPNLIMIIYYHDQKPLPLYIIIVNIVAIIATFFINIFNTRRGIKLIQAEEELVTEKTYISTLKELVDELRTFKHDYDNTLLTIDGYAFTGDIDGLRNFVKDVIKETKKINALNKLNPELFKNPSIFGLTTAKFGYAKKCEVTMNFEIYADLGDLDMKTFDFTRILGIFLDNAIQAAASSEKKIVNFYVVEKNGKVTIDISNTFSDTGLKVEDMNKKGVSSKGENRGLGLYKVKDILTRYPKVMHETTMANGMFLQRLVIEKIKLPVS